MAFLQIGPVTIDVVHGSPEENTAHELGSSARALDGLLQSGVRSVKRRWSCSTLGLSEAEVEALFAVVQPGSFHTCTGDIFGGTTPRTLDCLVELAGEALEEAADTPEGYRRVLHLVLHEA